MQRHTLKLVSLEELTSTPPPPPPLPTRERLIGRGAFGQVYAGTLADHTPVCIKVAKADQLLACRQEAELLSYLAPGAPALHVPRFYQLIEGPEEIWLVMQQLGSSLEHVRLRMPEQRLDLVYLATLAYSMIGQLEQLHRTFAVIHCDIKPENLLLDSTGHQPYLIDFGLSQRLAATNTPTPIRGTQLFLSPHIHQRQTPSPRDDLYSLGYTLIHLYLGALPWKHICLRRSTFTEEELHTKLHEAKTIDFPRRQLPYLPTFFNQYFAAIDKLTFNECPPYDELKRYAAAAASLRLDSTLSDLVISHAP